MRVVWTDAVVCETGRIGRGESVSGAVAFGVVCIAVWCEAPSFSDLDPVFTGSAVRKRDGQEGTDDMQRVAQEGAESMSCGIGTAKTVRAEAARARKVEASMFIGS